MYFTIPYILNILSEKFSNLLINPSPLLTDAPNKNQPGQSDQCSLRAISRGSKSSKSKDYVLQVRLKWSKSMVLSLYRSISNILPVVSGAVIVVVETVVVVEDVVVASLSECGK